QRLQRQRSLQFPRRRHQCRLRRRVRPLYLGEYRGEDVGRDGHALGRRDHWRHVGLPPYEWARQSVTPRVSAPNAGRDAFSAPARCHEPRHCTARWESRFMTCFLRKGEVRALSPSALFQLTLAGFFWLLVPGFVTGDEEPLGFEPVLRLV